jgi:hypothetical protein
MNLGMRLLGASIGLLVLTGRLAAQTLPVPVLPPEPAPEPGPTPSPAAPPQGSAAPAEVVDASARPRLRPWEYALGVGVDWDGNIDFLAPNGPGGVAVVPRGGLSRVVSASTGQLRATAAAGGTGYLEQGEPRRYYADFDLEGRYQSSPSTNWDASARYGFGYSDSSRILLEQGVSLPVVKTRSLTATLGLSKNVGAHTSLRIDGRVYRTEFDSPGLIDGQSVRGTIGLERQLSHRSTAAIRYSLEGVRSGRQGRSYFTHFASVQVTRVLSLRSALLLEGGGSDTPDAARAALEQKGSFFGGASFTRQIGRSSLTLFVRHEVTPAFGLGVSHVDLRSGLRGAIPVGRGWEVRMVASHVQPRSGQVAERMFASSDEAFVALGRRLGRHLELSGEGRYRRRSSTRATPAIEAFRAGVFLALLTPSGGAIALAPAR